MLTEAEREALRQRNIAEREQHVTTRSFNVDTNEPQMYDTAQQANVRQAMRARDFAEREDRDVYDDAPVGQSIVAYPSGPVYLIAVTKHGRTYQRLLGDPVAEWTEIAEPLPRTHARRTWNGVRKASGDVADALTIAEQTVRTYR